MTYNVLSIEPLLRSHIVTNKNGYHDVGLQLVDEIDDGSPLEEREVRRALKRVAGHQEQGRQAALVGQSPLLFHELGDPREPAVAPAQRRVVFAALVAVQVRLVEPAVHVVGVEQHQVQAGRVRRDRGHRSHDGQTRGGDCRLHVCTVCVPRRRFSKKKKQVLVYRPPESYWRNDDIKGIKFK
jgi:hypothetical protein